MPEWDELEEGVDVRLDEFGRFEIKLNDPNGYSEVSVILRTKTAMKLYEWLKGKL